MATATPYGSLFMRLGRGELSLTGASLKAMLVDSTYLPNVDTDDTISDVTGEVTGTGYTAGGLALSGITWTYDAANHRCVLGADPLLWSGAAFTARYLVVYNDSGDPSTSELVGYIDYGVDKSPASEDFQQSFTNGVLRLSVVIGA